MKGCLGRICVLAGGLFAQARFGFILLAALSVTGGFAQAASLELTLRDAEAQALRSSDWLRSYAAEADVAKLRAQAQYAELWPRLSLEAGYTYLSYVPSIVIAPGTRPLPFGDHSNYSIGPTLRYTLWDTGASRNAYRGGALLAQAREEDRKNVENQLLLSVRSAYFRVQLALEELRLTDRSLRLARAQDGDITARFRAGAATKLDLLTSHREVLNYELQFKQQQSVLSGALRDLLAQLGESDSLGHSRWGDLSHPGTSGMEQVTLAVRLDSLDKLVGQELQGEILPPDGSEPSLRAQELLAESSESWAASQRAELFPTVQLTARSSLEYPNGPVLQRANQNMVSVNLTLPLFESGRTRRQAAARIKEAETARYREGQLRSDIQRDFAKASEAMSNLREQRELAARTISESEELARLNYDAYLAGKIKLTDVQAANLQVLQARVNAVRIDARILTEAATLKSLSGKELRNG